jgi:D-aminoacyl-tRNA deacylase
VAATRAPRLALVYSTLDPAGSGAAEALRGILGQGEPCTARGAVACSSYPGLGAVLAAYPGDTTGMEYLDESLDAYRPDAYIVLSRHASTSGRPTLSLHYPGNPGPEAALGGRPRELAYTWPRLFSLLARLYHREAAAEGLLEQNGGRYSFSLEATHHGPTSLTKPIIFIEIGSTPDEWRDEKAHKAMAEAVASLLRLLAEKGREALPSDCRTAVGLGGTHYPEKHTRLLLEGRYCYGHIFAKYTFQHLSEETLEQALEKTVEPIEGFVVLKVPGRVRRLAQAVAEKRGLELWRP